MRKLKRRKNEIWVLCVFFLKNFILHVAGASSPYIIIVVFAELILHGPRGSVISLLLESRHQHTDIQFLVFSLGFSGAELLRSPLHSASFAVDQFS
jgi:hypothetical protein